MDYTEFLPDVHGAKIIADNYNYTPKAFMHSFGCQQNVSDGEYIKGVLAGVGFGECDNEQDADLILFNTCAVRELAQSKVFSTIGNLKELKASKPHLIVGLCGCMVQQQEAVDKIKKSYPFVELVFGVNQIDLLPSMIAKILSSRKKYITEPMERSVVVENMPVKRDSTFKAWVPIMYGCDNFCSYCIVPYVRGRERSRTVNSIITEIKGLVETGYKEITLLGQNVNSYGKGLDEPCDFPQLLEKICEINGEFRVRYMSSHPKDFTKELIDVMAKHSDKICNSIHIPVQSGSDDILMKMNRRYTVSHYKMLIDYAKEKIADVTFSSDILVGFPNESDEDFECTLDLIKDVRYMQLFTFIYSKRTGTKAALMPDAVTHEEKAQRINKIKKVQEEILPQIQKSYVGRILRGLIEVHDEDKDISIARLDNNITVVVDGGKELLGQFVDVNITGMKSASMVKGEIIQK